jgi:hypothetical protein
MNPPSLSDPVVVRGLMLAFGLVLCVFGSYLYQLVVLAPGLLGGLWGGLMIGKVAALGTTPTLGIAGGLALAGALLCHFLENWAVRLTGVVSFGAIAWALWPHFRPEPAWETWAVASGASLVGGLIFPRIYSFAVKVATSAMGGLLLAEAAGHSRNLWIVGGATVLGTLVQTVPWKRGGSSVKKEKKEKK